MTIVLTPTTSTAPLSTYDLLQASIASWLHRTDLTTVIPDLIAICESRIARDLRIRRQITAGSLTTTANTQSTALPTDFLEAENLSIISGGVNRNLEYVNIERMDLAYPVGSGNGVPVVYTFEGASVLWGPVPDASYTINLYYYARLSPLSTTLTNWLLTNYPDVYLFGSLAEAADYTQSKNIEKWEAKYKQAITELQKSDNASMFSGSAIRVRTI
jgi:hypothetical protein